jgi:hypothetical protein
MKSLPAAAGAAALMIAGAWGGSAATGSTAVRSATVAPGQHAALASLPGLGRFTAACRHGRTTVAFRATPNGATETVALTSGGAARSVTLEPGRTFRAPRLRGVAVWQVAAISEGRILVGGATLSAARMPGSAQCFVTLRAEVAGRAR